MSTGRTVLGLLGHPVGHSLSAPMHRAALRELGLAGDYEAHDVGAAELGGWVERLRSGAIDGLNVTLPHKEAAARLADELAGDARTLGAVNTLCRASGGGVVGHNTDLPGLTAALRSCWPDAPWSGRTAVVRGAGGAARAAVAAASETGAATVVLVNRSLERAHRLCADVGPAVAAELRAAPPSPDALAGAALVLQATSAAMGASPGTATWRAERDGASILLGTVAADAVVYDLIYRPEETPWLAAARVAGLRAESGLEMLVRQAAASLTLWTGREAPVDAMRRAVTEALGR